MDSLEEKLAHVFTDKALLRRALTHASADSAVSNERLEFLGDRVLGLVIAETLHERFPQEPEGLLTRRLHALVRWESCALVGEEIGLWPALILTKSETANDGGRARGAIVGSAVEALIAALYLDGGFEVARDFVLKYWQPRSKEAGAARRDPKTELQEWSHQVSGAAPAYVVESREGPDHDLTFTVRVEVPGHEPARGVGSSKQAAQQAAAAEFMTREGVR